MEIPDVDGAGTSTDDSNSGGTDSTTNTDYEALVKQAQAEAADWKKRFTGLQGAYQRDQAKWGEDSKRLTSLEETIKGLDDERTKLQEIAKVVPDLQAQLNGKAAEFEKLHTIATEFPSLLNHYKEGLLPDGTGDEWKAKLEKLASTYADTSKRAVEDFAKGGVPRTPGSQSPSRKELLDGAMTAMRKGDLETYNKLYGEYLDAQQATK